MTKITTTAILTTLTAILLLAAWLFWAFLFPHALAFHEQLQCFLFDTEYLAERIIMPAGISRYIAEFLVQLYNKVYLGAIVISIILTILHLSTYRLSRPNHPTSLITYILSFIPSLMLWYYMGDVNVNLTFPIAILITQLAMLLCPAKPSTLTKAIYLIIATPLLAWITGPTTLILALYIALRDNTRKPIDYISLAMLLYAPACILACAPLCTLPVERLFYGYHYSMVIDQFPVMQYIIMAIFALTPIIPTFLPHPKTLKTTNITAATLAAVIITTSTIAIHNAFSSPDYEVIKYDAMVRAQKWDEIIATAERNNPSSPLTVASLNLALAIKGQLNQRAAEFYQNGWQGAFPLFNKHYQSSLMTAEIYFYLGLINSAQRLDFEAMEALPDNAKSVRAIKRLAETNIINGQYEAARKYLLLLQRTMFYSAWATRTMSMLYNDKAIDQHQLYGRLRRLHLDSDFVFSDTEIDKIMGQLVMHNHHNTLAAQYLLLLPQLEGNQQKYILYRNILEKTLAK